MPLRVTPLLSFHHSASAAEPVPVTTPIQPSSSSLLLTRSFLLMGRDIVAVDAVPPGNIFGVLGLEGCIMKSGTLSDTPQCPSLSSLRFAVAARLSCHD